MQIIVFGVLVLLAHGAGSERVLLTLDIKRLLVLAVDKVVPPKIVGHRDQRQFISIVE